MAKLCHFYPGLKPSELKKMSEREVSYLWESITVIEAQDALFKLTAMDWPNMGQNSREKLHKQLFKKAYPASFKKTKVVSPQDMARLLGGG